MHDPGSLIEITAEVRETVRRSADAGLRATPARLEIGGILTGTVKDGRLLISGAEPVGCQHWYGAAYHLSPEECDDMRAAAEKIRASQSRQVAGYFRSCVGDRFRLFPDDEIILREILPEAHFILLVKPLAAGVSAARLFERNAAGSWVEAAQFEIAPGRPRALAAPRVFSAGGRSLRLLPIAGGLAVVILLVLAWYQASVRRPATVRSTSPFGMRISTQGDSFWLTWDRNSAAVTQASDGVLRILDGDGHRDIKLGAGDVRNGSVLYRPQSGDVTFDLELRRDGAVLGTESIRALDASRATAPGGAAVASSSAPSAAVPTIAGSTFRRARAAQVPAGQLQPQTTPQPLPNAAVAAPPSESGSRPEPSSPAGEQAPAPLVIPPGPLLRNSPLPVAKAVQTATANAEPPGAAIRPIETPVDSGASQAAAKPPESKPQAAPVQQPSLARERAAPQEVQTAAAAPPQTAASPAIANAPAPGTPLVTPPQPLRKVMPSIRNLGPQLFQPTEVNVLVSIDASGRVIEAHPVDNGKRINQALIGEAIKAAREWTFEPATDRGKPVPATHLITFRFARN